MEEILEFQYGDFLVENKSYACLGKARDFLTLKGRLVRGNEGRKGMNHS